MVSESATPVATSSTAGPGGVALHPVTGAPARTRLAAIIVSISCLPVLGAVLLAPVLPQMSEEYSGVPGAAALVPLVLTVPSLAIAVSAPIAGMVVDRIGRRRLLIVGLMIYAIVGTAPLYLPSLATILASRVLVGVTEAMVMTASTALMTDYFSGHRRNRYLALTTVVTSLSGAVFLVIGGALGEAGGWRTPFILYAVSLLVLIPVVITLWEPSSGRVGQAGSADRAARPALATIPARLLLPPVASAFVSGVIFFSIVVEMPYVFTELGVASSGTIGIYAGLTSLSAAAGSFAFRWLAGIGVARLVPLMLAAAAVGLVVIWLAPSAPVALVGALITSFTTGLMIPLGLVWIVAPLTAEQRGRAIGSGMAALFIGQFIAPLVVLGLQGVVGTLTGAMGVLAIVSVAGAVGFGVVLARRPQPDLLNSSL